MSTPVSVEPPPRAHLRTDSEQERDLQERLQRMILLQYQEQQLETIANENSSNNNNNSIAVAGPPKRSSTELMGLNVLDSVETEAEQQQQQQQQQNDNAMNNQLKPPHNPKAGGGSTGLPPPHPPSPTSSSAASGVGRGIMYFSSNYQGRGGGGGGHHHGAGISNTTTVAAAGSKSSGGGGGGGTVPMTSTNLGGPTRDHSHPPQQIYAGGGGGYGSVSDHHQHGHDFHYGNPDNYHDDPYDTTDDGHSSGRGSSRGQKSFCEKFCCLYRPLVNLLSQEHVHRSFCYGAIDGMLTGSGIVSAFRAMNVLTNHSRWEIRLAVVVFSSAACIADSLCMAIGHIWTSYVMSMGHAKERARERKLLNTSRADAKAKLVDALLSKGMLKIDAMSLADTLEGYPDLFIGTLVGDSLLSAGEDVDAMMDNNDESDSGRGGMSNFAFKIPSYGQLAEPEHNIDSANVNIVVRESQKEGFFMMVGFAVFAVLPSLLWLIFPMYITSPAPTTPTPPSSSSSHAVENDGGQTISLPSVILSICAVVMWFLGVWKSTFLDSNWAVFGIETVIVLFVCVLSSYGVGTILFYMLGDVNEGLALTNIPSSSSISS